MEELTPFERELRALLNTQSMENASDTPDFLLASYLVDCLNAFNRAVNAREAWYGRTRGEDEQRCRCGVPVRAPHFCPLLDASSGTENEM